MAIIQFLLVLLLISSALGIAACIRRGGGAGSWILGGAIVCTALLGLWRYLEIRSLTAANEETARRDLEAFVRPARVTSSDLPGIRLTWSVPCEAFSDSARREICGEGTTPGAAARAEMVRRFASPIEIGLTPVQRMIREGDDSLVRFVVADYGSTLRVQPDSLRARAVMTLEGEAQPARQGGATPPFIAAPSAEIRTTLPSPGCADGECVPTEIRVLAGTQWFCADRLIPFDDHRTFTGRLAACGGAVRR